MIKVLNMFSISVVMMYFGFSMVMYVLMMDIDMVDIVVVVMVYI